MALCVLPAVQAPLHQQLQKLLSSPVLIALGDVFEQYGSRHQPDSLSSYFTEEGRLPIVPFSWWVTTVHGTLHAWTNT